MTLQVRAAKPFFITLIQCVTHILAVDFLSTGSAEWLPHVTLRSSRLRTYKPKIFRLAAKWTSVRYAANGS